MSIPLVCLRSEKEPKRAGCLWLTPHLRPRSTPRIKKVTRVFERDVLARRALREVAILRHIGLCDNITALLDFDATFVDLSEIYLVLSASEADLSQIIRSGQALSDAHLQYFMVQTLRGVRYMHAANVLHRDLKPGNLLVNADCALRVCDFGLARAFADQDASSADAPQDRSPQSADLQLQDTEGSPVTPRSVPDIDAPSRIRTSRLQFPGGPLTEYVATRWYRAPEIMLCFREGYGKEIDMWSVGCILAELMGGKPIFAGKDYVDQIARINNVLGSPSEATMSKIGSERAKTYIKSLPRLPAVPFEKLYPSASPEALDLLSKLLTWDPDERMSAVEALNHPWLKAYRDSNANFESPPPFNKFAETELIKDIGSFKAGLEREADEMRAELAAFEEEERALAAASQDQQPAPIEEAKEPSGATSNDGDVNAASSSSSCTSVRSRALPVSSNSTTSSMPSPSSPATSADETFPSSPSACQSLANSVSNPSKKMHVGAFPPPRIAEHDGIDEALLEAHSASEFMCASVCRPTYRRRAVSNAAFPHSRLHRTGSSVSVCSTGFRPAGVRRDGSFAARRPSAATVACRSRSLSVGSSTNSDDLHPPPLSSSSSPRSLLDDRRESSNSTISNGNTRDQASPAAVACL